MNYVPLWCKSNFSFLEGASHPEELVETCEHLGIEALALTDRDGLYGAVEAHLKARELGIHLILGAEVTAEEPVYDFVAPDGIGHRVWVVDEDARIDALIKGFADNGPLYVADGHHRSAAASRVAAARREANPAHTGEESYNYFLSVIFPHNQMQIMDYNRTVRDLHNLDEKEFMSRLEVPVKWQDRESCINMTVRITYGCLTPCSIMI